MKQFYVKILIFFFICCKYFFSFFSPCWFYLCFIVGGIIILILLSCNTKQNNYILPTHYLCKQNKSTYCPSSAVSCHVTENLLCVSMIRINGIHSVFVFHARVVFQNVRTICTFLFFKKILLKMIKDDDRGKWYKVWCF